MGTVTYAFKEKSIDKYDNKYFVLTGLKRSIYPKLFLGIKKTSSWIIILLWSENVYCFHSPINSSCTVFCRTNHPIFNQSLRIKCSYIKNCYGKIDVFPFHRRAPDRLINWLKSALIQPTKCNPLFACTYASKTIVNSIITWMVIHVDSRECEHIRDEKQNQKVGVSYM